MTKQTVAVFGSARLASNTELYKNTEEAAELLAANDWIIATGAGPGLMEAANKGAVKHCQDKCICSLGYSIYLPFENSINLHVQNNTHHNTFFTRLKQFTDECNAFIALPGGYGTLLEIMSVIQLLQVEHIKDKPLILVGSMWQDLMNSIATRLWRERFIKEEELSLWYFANDPIHAAYRLLELKPVR